VALDTSIFIYQLEGNPRYLPMSDYVFSWLEQPHSQAVTSTITMAALLVQPYRTGNEELADQFYGLLSTYPNLTWMEPSLEIADLAARLRAMHRLRTPDALLAATAAHAGATGLITNDPVFARVREFETLELDALL
jgi:predicted nucleic acid-binding protein